MSTPAFDERLTVPFRWWVQGVMFLATVWLAVVLWVPGTLAWTITAILVVLFAAAMLAYGSARVTVTDGTLRAGRATISASHLGAAVSLDAEEAWRAAGPDADARAFLVLRPYLKRAVRVDITDPDDPAPYWLIGTRHPQALADAITKVSERPGG